MAGSPIVVMENKQADSIMKLAKESDVDYSVTERNIMHTCSAGSCNIRSRYKSYVIRYSLILVTHSRVYDVVY